MSREKERGVRKLRHSFADKPQTGPQPDVAIKSEQHVAQSVDTVTVSKPTTPEIRTLPNDAHKLEEGDTLERLVDEWRAPQGFVVGTVGGGFMTEKKEEIVFCFIPPEGTQPGDILAGTPMDGYTVKSPQGEKRGNCVMYEMTPEQAGRIYTRVADYYVTKQS